SRRTRQRPRRAAPLALLYAGRDAPARRQTVHMSPELLAQALRELVDRLAHALGLDAAAHGVAAKPELSLRPRRARDARIFRLVEEDARSDDRSLYGRLQLGHALARELGHLGGHGTAGGDFNVHRSHLSGWSLSRRPLPTHDARLPAAPACAAHSCCRVTPARG